MRRDFFADPGAPAPERIVTRVFVAVVDELGRVLLHQRDSGPWSLPGGGLEIGESLEDCARREVREETGVELLDLQILTAVSNPDHVIVTGEHPAHQQVAVLAFARSAGQEPRPSPESPVVRFIDLADVDRLPLDPAQRGFLELLAKRAPQLRPAP